MLQGTDKQDLTTLEKRKRTAGDAILCFIMCEATTFVMQKKNKISRRQMFCSRPPIFVL